MRKLSIIIVFIFAMFLCILSVRALTDCTGIADGTLCDDGKACTINDKCIGEVCAGTESCPDQECATNGGCSSTGNCVYSNIVEYDTPCTNTYPSVPLNTRCEEGKCGICVEGKCLLDICSQTAELPTDTEEDLEENSGYWCPDDSGKQCPNGVMPFEVQELPPKSGQVCCRVPCGAITPSDTTRSFVRMMMTCKNTGAGWDYLPQQFCLKPETKDLTPLGFFAGIQPTGQTLSMTEIICSSQVPKDCSCEGEYQIYADSYDPLAEENKRYLRNPAASNILAYTINYDEDAKNNGDNCKNCAGVWDAKAPDSYDLLSAGITYSDNTPIGSCCGDDTLDDPDMGEAACELCQNGLNARSANDVGPWPGRGLTDGGRRDWDDSVPQGKGCCGDDETDCLIENNGKFCFDVAGVQAAVSTGGGGTTGSTGPTFCGLGQSCGGGTGGSTPSETTNLNYNIEKTIWGWAVANSPDTKGIVARARCADLPVVSDGSVWHVCGRIGGLTNGQVVSYNPKGEGSHNYICYKDENEKFQIAECCGGGTGVTANCYSLSNNVNYGVVPLYNGDSIEAILDDGSKKTYYCNGDYLLSRNLDAESSSSMDALGKAENTCLDADLGWTGHYCCSEEEDQFKKTEQAFFWEWYNDEDGVCAGDKSFVDGEIIEVNEEPIQELIVSDGKFHGCAIDERNSAGKWISNTEFGSNIQIFTDNLVTRKMNKPVEGGGIFLGNLAKNPNFEEAGDWSGGQYVEDGFDGKGLKVNYNQNPATQSLVNLPAKIAFSVYIKADTEVDIATKLNGYLGIVNSGCVIGQGKITSTWTKFQVACKMNPSAQISLPSSKINGVDIYYDSIMLGNNDELLNLKNCPDPANANCNGALITDHGYCDVIQGYYCSYNETWKSGSARSFLSYLPNDATFLAGMGNPQDAECCEEGKCWDGKTCVDNQRNQGSDEPYPRAEGYKGNKYRCVDSVWVKAEQKYDWFNKNPGYCPNASTCLVNPTSENMDFDFLIGDFQSDDPTGDDILCISSGKYLLNHYCECTESTTTTPPRCTKTAWTSRTKNIAKKLVDYKGEGKYTLFCGDFEIAANYPDYTRIRRYFGSNGENIGNICVLNDLDAKKIIIGIPLNKDLTEFKPLFEITSCTGNTNNYIKCAGGQFTVYYANQTNSLIFSKEGFSLTPTLLDRIFGFFKTMIGEMLGQTPSENSDTLSENYDFIKYAKDYNNIYIFREGEQRIFGIMEKAVEPGTDNGGDFLALKYIGFNQNICSTIEQLKMKHVGDRFWNSLTCTVNDNIYYVHAQDTMAITTPATVFDGKGEINSMWLDLTAKLRIEDN